MPDKCQPAVVTVVVVVVVVVVETAIAEVEIGTILVFPAILNMNIFRNQGVLCYNKMDLSKP